MAWMAEACALLERAAGLKEVKEMCRAYLRQRRDAPADRSAQPRLLEHLTPCEPRLFLRIADNARAGGQLSPAAAIEFVIYKLRERDDLLALGLLAPAGERS